MKTTTRSMAAAIVAVAVTLALQATPSAQSTRVEGGVSSQPGFDFYWETRLEPAVPPLAQALRMTLLETLPNIVHRVMLDRGQKVYFGYDARVDVLPGNSFRLTFSPLSMTPEVQRTIGDDATAWRMLPAPQFPPPQTIRGGDVIELPLLVNSGWEQRLTDYVTVREPGERTFDGRTRELVFTPGAPRDFTVDDAELRLTSPLVTMTSRSGQQIAYMQRYKVTGEFAGPVLWVYVPYRGRFLLSLRPLADLGFQKAGEIRGTSLRFTVAGTAYSLESEARIASGQATFNLYVLRQPGWKPTYPNANVDVFHIGSADRAGYLVAK